MSNNNTSSNPIPNPVSSIPDTSTNLSSQAPNPSDSQEAKKGYYQSSKDYLSTTYNNQYTTWKPWLEDRYLAWFGKDNKASYVAKENLDKTKLTGISQVDKLQDGVNELAAGQIGKGGLAQPLGDAVSKEGINRAERGGQDEKGGWVPGAGDVAEGGKGLGGGLMDGAKGVGGKVGGLAGGLVGGGGGGGGKGGSGSGGGGEKK